MQLFLLLFLSLQLIKRIQNMIAVKHIFTFIVSIILMSPQTWQGSVPVTWQRSTFFNSGQFVCTPTSSGSSFSTTTTYSPALTGNPTKRPSLGITDMNFQFTLPTVYFKIELGTFTQTTLTVNTIVNYGSTFSMKIYYLAPDPTMTYQYSSFNWNSTNSALGPYTGPFHSANVLGISGLSNPSGMNMSHEVTMLPFINGFNITSSSYCFEIILRTRVYGSNQYQMNFTSDCPGMVMSLVCWSRIIFDITAIEDLGYCYFQYGTYSALNNDDTSLFVLLKPFIAGNFLLGISEFKYTSPTAPIIMSFSTSLADLIQTQSNTQFQRLAMTYWSLKYRYCPPAYPVFHLDTQTCHDLCPQKTYYSSTLSMCKDCFYTCKTCTGYPACSSCQPTQNRILTNNISCLPEAGFYDNGTAYAPPCTSQCIDCTNETICLACDSGYFLNITYQCQMICMQGCTICTDITTCTFCDVTNGYYLDNTTCVYCNYSLNNFINMTTLQCQTCNIVGCATCFSLTVCNACDLPNSYAIEGLICEYCNNTMNQFINSSSLCEMCTQPGCITCLSLTTCSSCNNTQNYYLNSSVCYYCNSTLNYFMNATLQCQLCGMNQCIQCASLTSCSACNIMASYSLINQTCKYCNNSLNYFINLTNSQCEACSIQGCITCSSLSTCVLCNASSNYYTVGSICGYCNNTLNDFINSSSLCEGCAMPGCITCSSLTTCASCNLTEFYYLASSNCQYCNLSLNYYISNQTCEYCNNSQNFFINLTNSQCEACSIQGCTTCSSLTTCSFCNSGSNYYSVGLICGYCNNTMNNFINSSSLCESCSMPGCITCSSLTTCSVCNLTDLYYLASSNCQYCNLSLNFYISSNQTCEYCNNSLNYFINLTNSQCEACSIQGCIICSSLSTCTLCNASSNYYIVGSICGYCNNTMNDFINSSSLCESCTMPGCITCSSLTMCSSCNLTEFYYLASSSCQYCNLTLNYYIDNQTCEYCNNSLNYFINLTNSQCEACSIQGCITCSSLSTCTLCNASSNYYILGSICSYCNNTLNNFINSSSLCQQCSMPGCITCSSLTTCSSCNLTDLYYLASSNCQYCNLSLNYYISNQTCEYCNNSLNYFINLTNSQCEACSLVGCITCSSLSTCTLCNASSNYYTLGFTCGYCNNTINDFINPNTSLCQTCTLSECVLCNNLQTCQICNNTGGYFLNQLFLCQPCQMQGCIQCQTLTTCKVCDSAAKYSLSSSGICSHCNKCECYLQKQLPSSIPSIEYSQNQCRNFQKTDSVLYGVAIVSISVMVLATFSTCLIGIELIGVLQLAYLNMADNLFVHLYLSPILGWYYANGYNIRPVQFLAVPPNIQQIGYTSAFLSNINVMFGILLFSTILLAFIEVLARVFLCKIDTIRKITRQIYMATYLFNCFNVAFSLGLQYRYYRAQDFQDNYYALSVVCASLVIPLYIFAVLWLSFARKIGCGQYTQRFKQDCTNQLYVPFTIVYRFALGIYMSTDSQEDNSTLLILSISMGFVLFNLINLSYKKFYHNYRANLSHLTHLIILMVTNYYRSMKKNYPIQVKASITTPAIIEIAFIGLCVTFALVNGIYEIVVKIKNIRDKKNELKINSEQTMHNNSTLAEMTHENEFTHSKNKFVETQVLDE